jgi:hypothetical protein
MIRRILTSTMITAMLAAPAAFARHVDPAQLANPAVQARADLDNPRCILASEDSRCLASR